MKLFRISQNVNDGYDTYDSAIVAAPDTEAARRVSPSAFYEWDGERGTWVFRFADGREEPWGFCDWWAPSPDQVNVEYIGEAADNVPAGVVLASFNAG